MLNQVIYELFDARRRGVGDFVSSGIALLSLFCFLLLIAFFLRVVTLPSHEFRERRRQSLPRRVFRSPRLE